MRKFHDDTPAGSRGRKRRGLLSAVILAGLRKGSFPTTGAAIAGLTLSGFACLPTQSTHAESPRYGFVMPPLPLQNTPASTHQNVRTQSIRTHTRSTSTPNSTAPVRTNRFVQGFETVRSQSNSTQPAAQPIQQAVDVFPSAATPDRQQKLKPIGSAVGLDQVSIPARVRPPAIVIEPVGKGRIRTNPLVGSIHHDNPNLVHTGVTTVAPQAKQATDAVAPLAINEPLPVVDSLDAPPVIAAAAPTVFEKQSEWNQVDQSGNSPRPIDSGVALIPPVPLEVPFTTEHASPVEHTNQIVSTDASPTTTPEPPTVSFQAIPDALDVTNAPSVEVASPQPIMHSSVTENSLSSPASNPNGAPIASTTVMHLPPKVEPSQTDLSQPNSDLTNATNQLDEQASIAGTDSGSQTVMTLRAVPQPQTPEPSSELATDIQRPVFRPPTFQPLGVDPQTNEPGTEKSRITLIPVPPNHGVTPQAVTPQAVTPNAVAAHAVAANDTTESFAHHQAQTSTPKVPAEQALTERVESEPITFSLTDQLLDQPTQNQEVAQSPTVNDAGKQPAGEPFGKPLEHGKPLTEVAQDHTGVSSSPMATAMETQHTGSVPHQDQPSLMIPDPRIGTENHVDGDRVAHDEPVRENRIGLDSVRPIVLDGPNPVDELQPMDSVIPPDQGQPIAIYRAAPHVAQVDDSLRATLHAKRYRPPVAVMNVPVEYQTFETAPDSKRQQSPVKAAEAPVLNDPNASEPTDQMTERQIKATALQMGDAPVRTLTLGGTIRQLEIEDEGVCRAIAISANRIKLVSTGPGVTRLIVWADVESADGVHQTRRRAFDIHVDQLTPHADHSTTELARQLNQAIAKSFPHSAVRVHTDANGLTVQGACSSDTTAKQIIRMIRKQSRVPVQDRILIR